MTPSGTSAASGGLPKASAAARVDWVDYAKGICIVMVVMMHSVLGVELAAGETGFMHVVVAFAKPFRMPDFFLISGLFLPLVIDRDWRTYLDRKVVHFAYFYVVWVTIQFGFKAPAFAAESGWKPTVFVTYAASSVTSLKAAGLENSKGVLTGQFVKPVGSPAFDNDAGVKQYVADYEKFKPRFDRHDSLGQMGYLIADGVVKVLEQMKTPTREAMMEAARNMNKVELGLLYPGITMTTKAGADNFPIEAMHQFQEFRLRAGCPQRFDHAEAHATATMNRYAGGLVHRDECRILEDDGKFRWFGDMFRGGALCQALR